MKFEMGSANVMTEEVVRKIVEEGQQFIERKELTLACNHFGQALGEIVEKYGEQHEILGDVYYYYGMALLGLVREESDVLPENMFNKPDEDQDDSDSDAQDTNAEAEQKDEKEDKDQEKELKNSEKPEEKVKESKEEGNEEKEENKENEEKEKDKEEHKVSTTNDVESNDSKEKEEKVENSEQNDQVPDSSNENDKTETNGETKDKADGAEAEAEDENVPDLQVAWEVLELAKKIFVGESRQDMLVNTLNLLGEVSLESENFDTAIEDFSESLKIQKEHNYGNRQQADIHFKLGLAYSMLNKFEDAISHFKNSQELLSERVKALKANESQEGGLKEVEKTEISEIEALLPEIEGKISDLLAYKDETQKSVLKLLAESSKEENGASTSSKIIDTSVGIKKVESSEEKDKDVNDISHLVRRKRKLDDSNEADGTPSKLRQSPSST